MFHLSLPYSMHLKFRQIKRNGSATMESIATVNTPNFILTILLFTISYYKGAKLFTFLRFMILYMIMSKSLIFFCVTQLPGDECSLLPYSHYWISSKRILTSQGFISGSGFSSWSIYIWLGFLPYFPIDKLLFKMYYMIVEINEGKIVSIVEGYGKKDNSVHQVIDYGDAVVMPGLIDV